MPGIVIADAARAMPAENTRLFPQRAQKYAEPVRVNAVERENGRGVRRAGQLFVRQDTWQDAVG
jgi:hypothetical protein